MAASTVIVVRHAGINYPLDTIAVGILDTVNFIRFKQADESERTIANAIPIPAANNNPNFSYRKYLKLYFKTAPPYQITNLRWYPDLNNPLGKTDPSTHLPIVPGVTLLVAADIVYTAPNVLDTTQDMVSSLPGGADAVSYTPTAPLQLVGTGSAPNIADPVVTNAGFIAGTGNQPFTIQQMKVDSTAKAGSTPDLPFFFSYDEQ